MVASKMVDSDSSHFTDFEQAKIVNSHYSEFEPVKSFDSFDS